MLFRGATMAPRMAADDLWEILCRGPERCGMFVSAEKVDACPRCRSRKVQVRAVSR